MVTAWREWYGDLTGLARDTARVWWGLLPRLLWLIALGDIALHTAIRLAVVASRRNAWLALGVFSLGIVAVLTCTVLALRAIGTWLGVRRLLEVDDARDTSITALLGLTLLPYLGIWATFGNLEQRAQEMHVISVLRYSPFEGNDFLARLNPLTSTHQFWLLAGILLATYLLGRALDVAHDRTGAPVLGLLGAIVQGFFMLCSVLSVTRLVWGAGDWIAQRRVTQWAQSWAEGLQDALHLDLGFLTDVVWPLWSEQLWPTFGDVVLQPLLWLGVALLVFGRAVSSADLLERSRIGRSRSTSTRKAVLEMQGLFAGDIDDRWLPMFDAGRLVLRAGVCLLGAYVVLFSLWRVLAAWVDRALVAALGGHDAWWWELMRPFVLTVVDLVTQPVLLCLVGATTVRAAAGWRRTIAAREARAAASDAAATVAHGDTPAAAGVVA